MRTHLATVVVLPLALVCVAPAFARPEGARVVAGTATVSKLDAATTLVTQTAERAVIEWQGLTLAANERLVLRQPGPSAMTVLRVVGDEPCRVSGRLQANGQVLLTDPRGVEFGEACRATAAGILASTLPADNLGLTARTGPLHFSPGTGRVVNEGRLLAAQRGWVALVGSSVVNLGRLEAPGGSIALISGAAGASPGLQCVRFVSWFVGGFPLSKTPAGDEGLVRNGGTIDVSGEEGAASGRVTMEGVRVEQTGTIRANGAPGGGTGRVDLHSAIATAVTSGSVTQASGWGAHSRGGDISVTSNAKTLVARGARLETRAGSSGDGGRIKIGQGVDDVGFETTLVDAAAPGGTAGTLLIDPPTLTVANGAGADDLTNPIDFWANSPPNTIYEQTLEGIAPTTNIILQAQNQITLNDLTDNLLNLQTGPGNRVVLRTRNDMTKGDTAAGGVQFLGSNDAISTGGGLIRVEAGYTPVGDVTAAGTLTPGATADAAIGNLTSNGADSWVRASRNLSMGWLNAGAGSAFLTAATGAVADANGAAVNVTAGSTALTAASGVGSAGNPFDTQVTTLAASGGTGGIVLGNTGALHLGTVGTVTGVSATGERIEIGTGGPLTVDDAVSLTGGIGINLAAFTGGGPGNLTLNAAVTAADGDGFVTVQAIDNVVQNAGGNVGAAGSGAAWVYTVNGSITMADGTSVTAANGLVDLEAHNNVALASASTGAAGAVLVFTSTGAITDANGAAVNAIGGYAELVAGTGIGAGDAIETQATTLAASGGSGGVNLANTGALHIGHVNNTSGVTATGGNIAVTASSPLTIDLAVSNMGGGTINLTAGAGGAADDLALNAAVTASGGNGNITLTADDNVLQNAGGNVDAAGSGQVNVTATNGSITMANGTTTQSGTGAIGYTANSNAALGSLSTTGGTVTVTATNGAVTEVNGAAVNVTADSLEATAKTAIDLDTTIDTLEAHVTGTGDMAIDETDGIALTDVDATNGYVRVASGGPMDAEDVHNGGSSRSTKLTAASGDLAVGVIGGAGVLHMLRAVTGAIVDGNGVTGNIPGGAFAMQAANGIGSDADPLETQVSTLAADGGVGGVYVDNAGNAGLMACSWPEGSCHGLEATGGNVRLRTTGRLNLSWDATLTGGGNLTLITQDSGGAVDDLVGVGGSSIGASGGDGSVTLTADDNVSQARKVSASGAGEVTVTAVHGSITMQSDAVTQADQGRITYAAANAVTIGTDTGSASGAPRRSPTPPGGVTTIRRGLATVSTMQGSPSSTAFSGPRGRRDRTAAASNMLDSEGDITIAAGTTIEWAAPLDSSSQTGSRTVSLNDTDSAPLEIKLYQPIKLGSSQTLTGQGTTVNVYPTGSVQNGIDVSASGATATVQPGTYTERIAFRGRPVTLRSTDPTDPNVVANTKLDGGHQGSVVTFNAGEGLGTVITGFTISGGVASAAGGGIYCRQASPSIIGNSILYNSASGGWGKGGGIYCEGSSPLIQGNTIAFNAATDMNGQGGGIACGDSSPVIRGNTIHDNAANYTGGGIYGQGSSSPLLCNNVIGHNSSALGGGICVSCPGQAWTIENNTLVGNRADGRYAVGGGICCLSGVLTIKNSIIAGNEASAFGGGIANYFTSSDPPPDVTYSDVWGNPGGDYSGFTPTGPGNLSEDPLFADAVHEDYHLKSRGGRWTPGDVWLIDPVHSPGIDAGDPASPHDLEPADDGARINLGFEGDTTQASKHWTPTAPRPDLMISAVSDSDFVGDGIYNDTGAEQTKRRTTDTSTRTIFYLQVQNDGIRDDSFLIQGPAGSGVWRVRYYSRPWGGQEITDQVTNSGWTTDSHATGGSTVLRAEVTPLPGARSDRPRSLLVIAKSNLDPTALDAVKAIAACTPIHKPDAMIKLPTDSTWTGGGVFNATGVGQTREATLRPGRKLTFRLRLENAGNLKEALRISGPAGSGNWTIAYYDAWSGGTDRTAQVTQGGWPASALDVSKAQPMRVEFTAKTGTPVGQVRNVLVTVKSAGDATRKDAVKAVVTVSGSATASQVTSLSALPTAMGAQITFSLSSAAEIDARVLNMAGRPVRALCRAVSCEAGRNTWLWDGQSDTGLRVPTGGYVIEITAHDARGGASRAVAICRIDR